MLDDLSDDTDKAKQALEVVTKQTQELIKQSGGMKNFIVIIVLVLICCAEYLVIMT
ncbi:hypothetical protein GQ600_12003 [Phytophthora cactorum]|nr:hypothetical protein GQ600_12003 [Phytophthora cactorum]